QHVRGGHPQVQPARVRADPLLHEGEEGDDIMLGGALDLLDARHVRRVEGSRALAAGLQGFSGGDALLHHALEGGELHVAPTVVAALVAPELEHFGAGITTDHGNTRMVRPLSAAWVSSPSVTGARFPRLRAWARLMESSSASGRATASALGSTRSWMSRLARRPACCPSPR